MCHLARGNDDEHSGVFAAIGNDATLRIISHFASQDKLSQHSKVNSMFKAQNGMFGAKISISFMSLLLQT